MSVLGAQNTNNSLLRDVSLGSGGARRLALVSHTSAAVAHTVDVACCHPLANRYLHDCPSCAACTAFSAGSRPRYNPFPPLLVPVGVSDSLFAGVGETARLCAVVTLVEPAAMLGRGGGRESVRARRSVACLCGSHGGQAQVRQTSDLAIFVLYLSAPFFPLPPSLPLPPRSLPGTESRAKPSNPPTFPFYVLTPPPPPSPSRSHPAPDPPLISRLLALVPAPSPSTPSSSLLSPTAKRLFSPPSSF